MRKSLSLAAPTRQRCMSSPDVLNAGRARLLPTLFYKPQLRRSVALPSVCRTFETVKYPA